jgi:putative nucleotidyltransferase with HDIG domain
MQQVVLDLLEASRGAGYFGEEVSVLEHALQAAHFARALGGDDELVVAALLHDIGHLCDEGAPKMADLGVERHEAVGARFLLGLGFRPRIVELVRGHVEAKRYLVLRRGLSGLSQASQRTLALQGGAMTEDEARRFEADPLFHDKIRLRKLDDLAKRTDLEVAPLESYRELVAKVRS